MKRFLEDVKALPKLQKASLIMAAIFLSLGTGIAVMTAFNTSANPEITETIKKIAFASAIFLYLMGAVMLLLYRTTETNRRLRGLADYVEGLRAYTVPRIDSIEDFLVNSGQIEEGPLPPPIAVPTESSTEKPLGTRERDTLLTIIAALTIKGLKLPIDKPGKTALYIEGLTDELGAPVSKRAIEDHLKKIPNALESRMK